jgi:hypothetical protein
LGLLIGTKYSGILLALGLLILYIKKINLFLNFKRLMILIIPIIIFGLSWYIRNYIITGNPVYPVPFFGFNGDPNYLSLTWTSWSVITKTSNGLWLMLQSFLSEYIFWSLSPFIILFLYFRFRRKKDLSLFNKYSGLIILSGINLLIFLPQPSWPILQITMSNMRFLYPMVIPLTLLVFILFKKISKEVLLAIIAVLSSVSFLPQLSFYPKLLLIWLLISFVFLFRYL